MADTLSDRLTEQAIAVARGTATDITELCRNLQEAAAELDRREAIVAAAEAWATAMRGGKLPHPEGMANCPHCALLALIPSAALKG
jgi:hypothetical protein